MSLDILEGDDLVYAGVDYPILKATVWEINDPQYGLRGGVRRMMVKTVSTKRAGKTGDLRTAKVTKLSNLKAGNLDPLNSSVVAQMVSEGLKTPADLRMIYVMDDSSYAELIVRRFKA